MFPRRPPTDEVVAVFDTLVAKQGQTTAPGNAGGTSIIDSSLIGAGANSFAAMGVVLYPGIPCGSTRELKRASTAPPAR